MTDYCQPFLRE